MNKILKIIIVIVASFVLIGATFAVDFFANQKNKLVIDKSQSYYSDFQIREGRVYIKCYITIKNSFNVEKSVTLTALSQDDVSIGLLKNAKIDALNEDGTSAKFVVPANSKKAFDVVFVGYYGGTNKKHNRNLPEITVKILDFPIIPQELLDIYIPNGSYDSNYPMMY